MSHPTLSIAYITSRRQPHAQWFLDSLSNQIGEGDERISVIFISKHDIRDGLVIPANVGEVKFFEPKPSVYQGKHRLTKEDFWDASGYRNTAIAVCRSEFLAYVDDLSVLAPGWLTNVLQSLTWSGVTLGAYIKRRKMVVEKGLVTSFEDYPQGVDSRWYRGDYSGSVKISGEFLYGCSLLAPVETFLKTGGWPEFCGTLSFEDVLLGIALENNGVSFRYNRNMLTYESDELHSAEPSAKRFDKGVSPNDRSHAALNMVRNGMKYFDNNLPNGIRGLREDVLSGKPFPIMLNPQHDWYDGQPLSDL